MMQYGKDKVTGAVSSVRKGRYTTRGSKITDSEGREIRFRGINWFGYNTGDNAFGGLDRCNITDMLGQISSRGFNLLRIPVSCELLLDWMNGRFPEAFYDPGINCGGMCSRQKVGDCGAPARGSAWSFLLLNPRKAPLTQGIMITSVFQASRGYVQ